MDKSRMNRRQFLQVAAGATGVGLLAACAPQATAPPSEPTKAPVTEATAAPGEAVKLQIMWRTNPNENPMVDELIAKLNEKKPDITSEQIVVPWEEYEPKLMSMYAAGIAPDIIGIGGTNPFVERSFRGMVLALDPYVEKEGEDFEKDLWPVSLKSFTIGGKLIAMTFALCNAGVSINATLFDEAGVPYPPHDWSKAWTLEEMVETAKKLTVDKNDDGKIDQYGLHWGHWSPWYHTRLWGYDLISKDDYGAGIAHKWQDSQDILDACAAGLQARADAIYVHKVTPSPSVAESLSQMGPVLKTGAVAMAFSGGWALWGDLPEQFKFRYATNPVGGTNGSGTTCNNTWTDPVQICSQTKNSDAAWEWTKFMTVDPDAIAIEISHRSTIPAAKSAFDAYIAEYSERLAMSEEEQRTYFLGSLEQAETTVPCHILVGWAATRDTAKAELDPVWLGEKTAKEAVDSMLPKVNQTLEETLKQLDIS